jgi:ClpP class serine protease
MPSLPTFVLSARSLVQHRRGSALALDSRAIGAHFALVDGPRETRRSALSALTDSRVPSLRGSSIATVSVFGPLSQRAETFCGWIDGYDSIAQRTVDALNDPEVAGVVMQLDSPGGDVAGLEDCVRRICVARDTTGKPIAVYVDELAASAGYWLAACVANAGVYAPRSGQVGSIGVYCMLADETKALEQEGISVQLVRDPPGKDAANPMHPVPDVAMAQATGMVQADAARFYAAISMARGMTPADVRALNAGVLLADAAHAANLIDGLMSLEQVEAYVASLAVDIAKANVSQKLSAMRSRLGAASKRRGKRLGDKNMTTKNKAADAAEPVADPNAPPAPKGRATAADVAQSCNDCAQVCTDTATACESGTADEAITAATACIAACEANEKVLESFLGMAPDAAEPMDAKPADKQEPVPADVPAAMSVILRSTGKATPAEAVIEVEQWKVSHVRLEAEQAKLAADRKVLESQERRALVASLVKCGAELPATAWADQEATAPAEPWSSMALGALRDRVAKVSAAKVPAAPQPPVRGEVAGTVPARIVSGWKNKGMKGDALDRACAEYLRNQAAIDARNGRTAAQES